MTNTFTVITSSGQTVTRRSDAAYTHASETEAGTVRFHKTREAAERRAGRWGHVHMLFDAGDPPCIVCLDEGEYKIGPSATDGTFTMVRCHRCQA